ncbi:hypothetical protein WKW80_30375 [Variovorax humicola]|uniref:tRNA nuclease CdiA C-terminal domain-containing protein n=1 Tax=Variovorax humicola TaxID=1769758 RepID=A0ABU8W8C0_9BURK
MEQLPNNQGSTKIKQPDLTINGELADVYSPKSGDVQSIWDADTLKADPSLKTFRAKNIGVNLADSPLNASEVAQYVQRNPVPGLRNFVLIKGGKLNLNAGL